MPVKGGPRRPDLLPRGPTRDDNGFAVGSVHPTTISNSRSWLVRVVKIGQFIQGRHCAAPPPLIPKPPNQPSDALDIDASTPRIFMPHNRLQLVLADSPTVGQSMSGGVA
jgi:hypothetical protein